MSNNEQLAQPEGFVTALTDKEYKQLTENLIGNIPTRYGAPILSFFDLIAQKRYAEEQQRQQALTKLQEAKEEEKKTVSKDTSSDKS